MPSWLYVAGPLWALMALSALELSFVMLGAYAEGRTRPQHKALPIKRLLRLVSAHVAFFVGLLLLTGASLFLCLSVLPTLARRGKSITDLPDMPSAGVLFLAGVILIMFVPVVSE